MSDWVTDFRIRSGKVRYRKRAVADLCIEGECLSFAALKDRLGVPESKARAIYNTCREQPGPVTWQRLFDERERRRLLGLGRSLDTQKSAPHNL